MKVTVAIDSFKGSLSSIEAGNAVKEAVLGIDNTANVTVLPLADGGEGTVDAMYAALGGEMVTARVTGPLGESVAASYCILPGKTAVIEMAAAAGITLVKEEEKNPLKTTTYGVGELIIDAVNKGCRRFIVGIGGSVTNDGGCGMLSSLGFSFLDKNGNAINNGCIGLKDLEKIETKGVLPALFECEFIVACDVTNPLCGKNGCSAVFSPQKGAKAEDIPLMDSYLENFAEKTRAINKNADKDFPGAGAAGGLGFAFLSYLNAKLRPGINIILDEIGFDKIIKDADIVVTGEGRLDEQTAMGKAPIGVAKAAKKQGKRVIAFSGCVTKGAAVCNQNGIDAFFPIVRGVCTLEEALNKQNAYSNLKDTATQVFRLIMI